ncbi:MAG: ankyrin repeat domain-containing protein, partial [Leptospiraceae bacterium]|nr:ankyrin repeat domain-containing protein [Leptospiraceae bacterium]
GDAASCRVGRNSTQYDAATLQNLRYYRTMAGVPADVTFAEEYNAPARAAALMMEAKNDLSHGPDANWPCYTEAGKKGAGSSNLCLGCVGPNAIDAYVQDAGVPGVGHRVWALHPRQKVLGTGSSKRAHALYVFGDWRSENDVSSIKSVAWPPEGFVPYRMGLDSGYPWSFQSHEENADHRNARVQMSRNGRSIRLRTESNNADVLVWYPEGLPRATHQNDYNRPDSDVTIRVVIDNVLINGSARSFEYAVTFIDPEAVLNEPIDQDDQNDHNTETDSDDSEIDDNQHDVTENQEYDSNLDLPLLRAAYDGKSIDVQDLLQRGANPNATYSESWSALMYAAYFGHSAIVSALLDAGANPDYTYDGWDAAGLARHNAHEDIVRLLEARSKQSARIPATRSRGLAPTRP